MFREIRKKKNQISEDAAKRLLNTERRGIIAINGDNGYPYAVPINYLYSESENKIYFHGAKKGYKVDLLKMCDKICFTVYGNETVKEEEWAPYLRSVVIFGKCTLIENRDRAIELVRKFAKKYYPDEITVEKEVLDSGNNVQMFEIEIEHLTGKEIKEI